MLWIIPAPLSASQYESAPDPLTSGFPFRHDGVGALRHLGKQHREHLLLLHQARMLRYRPGNDLLAAEVVGRGQVGLAPPLLELGDVRAQLLPRPVGREVAAEQVIEGLADDALVGVVLVVVGLAPYAAAYAHLVHDLEHRLVRHGDFLLGTQAHRDLPVAAAVGGAREHLGDALPELRPCRRLRPLGLVVAVGRRRHAGCGQQVGEPVPFP